MQKKHFWALLALLFAVTVPLLWLTDFNTKGEPREAVVGLTMLEQHNWILPTNNGGEMAYKPPFFHWCIAAVSALCGSVSNWSARLPSALAGIGMLVWVYCFYARRKDSRTALLASLICLTCFEVHRALFACRVDMMLTLGIVGALLAFAAWAERERRGIPWLAIAMMSLGTLTKGPVAIALPCGVTFVYLLIRGERWWRVTGWMVLSALAAMVLPACWYYAAYQQGGEDFLTLVKEENVDRFLGKMTYASHENPWWYNVEMLLAGLLPWTLLVIGKKFHETWLRRQQPRTKRSAEAKSWKARLDGWWKGLREMDPVMLFSMLAAVLIFVFYCIPKSKRGVYLLPVYPFTAWFIAYYLRSWKTKTLRWVLGTFVAVWFLADAVALPLILNRRSDRDIAAELRDMHLTEPILSHVPGGAPHNPEHFFSINFYLHNGVDVWHEESHPDRGLLLIGKEDMDTFRTKHPDLTFERIYESPHKSCDTKKVVELYRFAPKVKVQLPATHRQELHTDGAFHPAERKLHLKPRKK